MKTTYLLKVMIVTIVLCSCSKNDEISSSTEPANENYSVERLRAYYNLNGNVTESRNGYNAEESNIIYEDDRNGNSGKAATFNGEDGVIVFPDVVRFDPTKSATLAFWIKTSQQSRFDLFDQRIGSNSPDNHNHGIIMNQGNINDISYNYPNYAPLGETSYMVNATICDGNWHHMVFVKDVENEKMSLYIDSALIYNPNIDQDYEFEINGSLLLGTNYNGNNNFEGMIDDIFIYERAITATDINILFNYSE